MISFSMDAASESEKVPRERNAPGEQCYLWEMDQAISLTVMLTSGIASVELLTVISPDLI